MQRKIYHVAQTEGSRWAVRLVGHDIALKSFTNKIDAITYAVDIARQNMPSQIVVHGRDGKIQEERTYGGDPVRYPG